MWKTLWTWILAELLTALVTCACAQAGIVTCANDLDLIPANTYMVVGRITPSASYATGGETFGTNNTLADVAKCLCNSPYRKPIAVLVEGQKGGFLYDFDHVNRKLRILYPVFVAGNTAGGNAVNAAAPSGGTTVLQTAAAVASAGESGVELVNGFGGLNSATFTVRFIALCS